MRAISPLGLVALVMTLAVGWFFWAARDSASTPGGMQQQQQPPSHTAKAAAAAPLVRLAADEPKAGAPPTDATEPGDPTPSNSPAWNPLVTVSGVVVDALSQQPLPETRIATERRGLDPATAAADGRFTIAMPIDDSGGRLLAELDGYLPNRVAIRPADVSGATAEVRIELTPNSAAAQLRGLVQDQQHQPLADCAVEIVATEGQAAPVVAAVETDAHGRFELAARRAEFARSPTATAMATSPSPTCSPATTRSKCTPALVCNASTRAPARRQSSCAAASPEGATSAAVRARSGSARRGCCRRSCAGWRS